MRLGPSFIMRSIPTRAHPSATLVALALVASAPLAQAQSIEPRSYSNAPVGVNFLIAGYAYTSKGVSFDTALPITDPQLHTSSAVVGYARVVDLWGKSGRFDVVVPYTWLSGTAKYQGNPVERDVNGFGDPLFRLSVNLYGAPALTLPEFRSYEQDLIIGASLQVSVPAGQYDDTKLVNLGAHRWFFRPEVGISKALGQWTLEFKAAATLFTDNNDFFNGNTRAQDPLYSFQAHAIYNFRSGIWGSVDATYFAGGRTTLDGHRPTTCSRTGASAGRSRFRSTSGTRSSSTRAAACRRALATVSICSGLRGSTAGAGASSNATNRPRQPPTIGEGIA